VRRHLYLITDHPNEYYIGKVEPREKAYTRTEKNVERPVDTLNIDTGERCTISVVGLGYHDFDDRDDYEESFKPVVDRKLREVDQQHLDKAGVEVDREVATDGGEPIDETHADAYYKWPYDHGTQYLGRMGTMAFALFDFDDSGLVFPLAMDQAEWERRREDFQEIDADELPEKAHNKIEAKFDRRKSISKLLPDGGQTAAENAESLSLHFSTGGPIELEVWDYENDEATHILTQYPDDSPTSIDLTKDLERAGFRLERIDDEGKVDTQYILTDAADEPIEGEEYDTPGAAIDARARLMATHMDGDDVTVQEVDQ